MGISFLCQVEVRQLRDVNFGIDYDACNTFDTKITEPRVQTRLCLAEQARVELASYRIAERLSTCLCRNWLRGALSAAEKSARQEPENRRRVGSAPRTAVPRLFDARIPPTGKGERTEPFN